MKNNIILVVYLLYCILVSACNNGGIISHSLDKYTQIHQTKFTNNNGLIDGMEPGVGYSSDTEHIAPIACFIPTQVIRDGGVSTLYSELSLNKAELAKFLNLGFNLKGGYAQFSANATLNYIKENNSNNLALSYNFVNMISRKVNIKYPLNLKKILNKEAIDVYDSGNNPKFRLFCGDRLIDGYTEGAFVITTIQVILGDKIQKQQFEASMGVSVAGFADLAAKIINYKERNILSGKIVISAFQLGGNPTQLSKIMPTSMSCSFDNINKCEEFYNTGVSDYLKNSFPNQFNKDSSFTPLGNLSFSPISLADDLNIKIASSYVTADIINARENLLQLYSNNLENYHALSDVLNFYPILLDTSFKKKVSDAMLIAEDNLTKLQEGKLCWILPNKCIKRYNEIIDTLSKQDNKYLISDFPPYAYQFSGRLKNFPLWTFNARFYPSSPTTYVLLPIPQAFMEASQKHLPIT
ncbi:MAG: hypothetical protein PHC75_09665, partial [Burkholderiales bacterium]|nr:hypothetical protein [Burkholderiales bacterium]